MERVAGRCEVERILREVEAEAHHYLQRAIRLLEDAVRELEGGRLENASEKAWGAVVALVKYLAAVNVRKLAFNPNVVNPLKRYLLSRGITGEAEVVKYIVPRSHKSLGVRAEQLERLGYEGLGRLFRDVSYLHSNYFYEGVTEEERDVAARQVRDVCDRVGQFIEKLTGKDGHGS